MKSVELYAQVRYAVQIEGISRREAARRYGIDPRTVAKMLAVSVPPGYRRSRPPARPKLDPFTGIIDRILLEDEGRPKKQRHTAKRIFERLRDEHGYSGGITIVKDYVRVHRLRHREVFVPLRHDPGHAQVDFGEALAAWRTLPGQIGEYDVNGNPRVTTGASANVDPAQCTSGGSFSVSGGGGAKAVEQLGGGLWRGPDGLVRNGQGEIHAPPPAEPAEPIVSPRRSVQHQSAVDILDRMLPIAPRLPPDAA